MVTKTSHVEKLGINDISHFDSKHVDIIHIFWIMTIESNLLENDYVNKKNTLINEKFKAFIISIINDDKNKYLL